MERTEEAAKVLRSLIADYPEIPEPYNNLAVIEAGLGNLEASVELLQKALVINPEFALARKNLGDVYLALAVENYKAAQPALPNNRVLAQRLRSLERILGN
jgi:tetratricopeptide (TPR) repeat protein